MGTHLKHYDTLVLNETLATLLAHHRSGWENELSDLSESQNLHKVHFVSLVVNGETDFVVDREYEDITKGELIDNIETEINQVLEPYYESDVIVGAGSSVKIIQN